MQHDVQDRQADQDDGDDEHETQISIEHGVPPDGRFSSVITAGGAAGFAPGASGISTYGRARNESSGSFFTFSGGGSRAYSQRRAGRRREREAAASPGL